MSIPSGGITPAGSYELNGFEPPRAAPAILADDIDPVTGEFRTLEEGVGIADGMVAFLLRVERGSGASVRSFGQRFRRITHVDSTAPAEFEAEVRRALKPATDSGTLRFEKLSAEVDEIDSTQINLEVTYTDLLAPSRDAERRLTFTP